MTVINEPSTVDRRRHFLLISFVPSPLFSLFLPLSSEQVSALSSGAGGLGSFRGGGPATSSSSWLPSQVRWRKIRGKEWGGDSGGEYVPSLFDRDRTQGPSTTALDRVPFHFLCLFWQSALSSDLGTHDNFSVVG